MGIRRDHWSGFLRWRAEKRTRFALSFHRQDPDIHSGRRILLNESKEPAIGRPRKRVLHVLALR